MPRGPAQAADRERSNAMRITTPQRCPRQPGACRLPPAQRDLEDHGKKRPAYAPARIRPSIQSKRRRLTTSRKLHRVAEARNTGSTVLRKKRADVDLELARRHFKRSLRAWTGARVQSRKIEILGAVVRTERWKPRSLQIDFSGLALVVDERHGGRRAVRWL